MLLLEARVAAHRGNPAAVAQSIHAIFGTCRAVEEDPLVMSHLVRVAMAEIAINELQVALESVEFSDADLRMLRDDVQVIDYRRGVERALIGERTLGLSAFRNPEMPLRMRANKEDLALYLSTYSKYIAASRQPYPEALSLADAATQEINELRFSTMLNRIRYQFASVMSPSADAVFGASARGTATANCADVALAIEQFHRANGKLPQTLAQLVPQHLAVVPIDPMDGQPLRYVVREDGYLLYSVGRNKVDDGGVMGDDQLDEVYSIKLRAAKQTSKESE